MFPDIPRTDIIVALTWINKQLVEHSKKREPVEFYISKDGNWKMDDTVHGSRQISTNSPSLMLSISVV